MATEIAKAYVQIIPSTKGIKDKLTEALGGEAKSAGKSSGASAAQSFGESLKSGLGSAASTLGGAMKTALTAGAAGIAAASAGVVAFGKSSIDAGSQFDASMSQVAATMGVTTGEIGELRDFAMEMGAKTAFSATQAADALNYMALAGYDSNEAMEALPNVLNLAAAGGIDLAYASDMVTDAQSALGLSMDESAELVDKMAMASSKSNTSVAQLGEAILTVGGTAKNLAGGTTELSTALGILADNGVKGAEGGTALRNIILSLSAPTDTASDALERLGINVFDNEGKMRSLNDIFTDFNGSLSSMTQGEQTQVLNEIFNKVDLKSVNALLANTGDRFNELSGYIDDAAGAAEKMANTQLDNLTGDVTLFQSALEGAKILVSDQLTPSLRSFVQFGTDGLTQVSDAFREDGLSGAIGAAKDIILEAGSTIASEFPGMVTGAVQTVLHDVLGVSQETTDSVLGVMSSFGGAVSEVWSAIGGAIDTVSGSISNTGVTWSGVLDGVAAAVSAAGDAISDVIDGIADAFGWATEQAQTDGTALNAVWDTVSGAVSGAWDIIQTAVNTIVNAVGWLKTEVETDGTTINLAWDAMQRAVSTVGTVISSAIDGITGAFNYFVGSSESGSGLFSNAWELAADLFASAVMVISDAISAVGDTINWLVSEATTDGTLINTVWEGISTNFSTMTETLSAVFGAFAALFNGDVAGFGQGLLDAAGSFMDGVKSKWETGWNLLLEILGPTLEAIRTTISTVWETITDTFTTVWETINGIVSAAVEAVSSTVSSVFTAVSGTVSSIWNGIQSTISSVWAGIQSAVSSAINAVSSTVSSVFQSVSNTVSSIWNTIKTTISTVVGNIKTTVSTAFQAVKTAITTPLNAAKSTVSSIFDSIKSAISDKINGAKDAVHSAIEAIKDKFNFTWSLPHLKLPHISITGSFSLSPPSAPHFSVSWYKKAMGNAMILDGASIFGAMGGQLLGGGEAGREVVAGEDHLMGLMRQTVGGEVGGDLAGLEEKLDRLIELLAEMAGISITINGADYKSKMELAEAIIAMIDRKRARREAAYG